MVKIHRNICIERYYGDIRIKIEISGKTISFFDDLLQLHCNSCNGNSFKICAGTDIYFRINVVNSKLLFPEGCDSMKLLHTNNTENEPISFEL